MSIDELIKRDNIPDKPQDHATTTYKFKRDLWEYFNHPQYKDSYFVEYGTSRGYTSMISSYLFKEVHTVNFRTDEASTRYLSSRSNIHRHIFDLYTGDEAKWNNIPFGDVYLIDALHTYHAVYADIISALSILPSTLHKKILVFDDYGAYPGVKQAIDEAVDKGLIEVLTYIGEQEGYSYGPPTQDTLRTLTAPEGLICRQV